MSPPAFQGRPRDQAAADRVGGTIPFEDAEWDEAVGRPLGLHLAAIRSRTECPPGTTSFPSTRIFVPTVARSPLGRLSPSRTCASFRTGGGRMREEARRLARLLRPVSSRRVDAEQPRADRSASRSSSRRAVTAETSQRSMDAT